ncbi:hypothetical protein B0H11DRAFT_2435232 [Mycena galericulata]|nr:hypothetical protein B0H11DRAFT_2435232 [Mycena galericulata]
MTAHAGRNRCFLHLTTLGASYDALSPLTLSWDPSLSSCPLSDTTNVDVYLYGPGAATRPCKSFRLHRLLFFLVPRNPPPPPLPRLRPSPCGSVSSPPLNSARPPSPLSLIYTCVSIPSVSSPRPLGKTGGVFPRTPISAAAKSSTARLHLRILLSIPILLLFVAAQRQASVDSPLQRSAL